MQRDAGGAGPSRARDQPSALFLFLRFELVDECSETRGVGSCESVGFLTERPARKSPYAHAPGSAGSSPPHFQGSKSPTPRRFFFAPFFLRFALHGRCVIATSRHIDQLVISSIPPTPGTDGKSRPVRQHRRVGALAMRFAPPGWLGEIALSSVTAYHSFGGEVLRTPPRYAALPLPAFHIHARFTVDALKVISREADICTTCVKEASMNKLCLFGAAALIATAFFPDVASAQRGGGGMRGGGMGFHGGGMGGGFRGGGMGGGFRGGAIGGGFRGGAIGGGFRGAAIGPGFRGGIGGGGFRGAAIGGFRGDAIRGGFGRVGIAGLGFRGPVVGRGVRVAGFRGGGWGWRRGWGGWGWPLAGLGLGLGYYGYPYYSSYYSDPCTVWDGYSWVNICY